MAQDSDNAMYRMIIDYINGIRMVQDEQLNSFIEVFDKSVNWSTEDAIVGSEGVKAALSRPMTLKEIEEFFRKQTSAVCAIVDPEFAGTKNQCLGIFIRALNKEDLFSEPVLF
ncbi:MAG: hypothetical protein OEV93_01015 [Candidatus Moranbacteria bacterium]|nr:hypothetical protein [Candidatus Moranbacteria bacterium]